MKILTRIQEQRNWTVLESERYSAESVLQRLLAESPSIIPIDEIKEGSSPLVVAIREFGLPGSGNTDVLAFSADGDVAIIECKLAANQEIKRKVIGQILEYGAYLWGMTYDELNQRVLRLKGKNLAELVAEAVDVPEWDEQAFVTGVREALANGILILVIAVDEINEELSRTIRFLNGCGNPAFSFHALEMRRFTTQGLEVLIPHLHGPSLGKISAKSGRGRWTDGQFFEAVSQETPPQVVEAIQDLYEWAKAEASRIWFGTGTRLGSFTFHYLRNGKTVSVFSVYTNGTLTLNYGWLSTEVEKDLIEGFHEAIHRIPQLSKIPADFTKWPTVKVSDVFAGQPEALRAFKEAVKALGQGIHSSQP